MADDLASLLAASGRVDPSTFDLSALADNYRKGKDWRYQQDGRELFKDGVPKKADGSLDYGAMRDTLFRRGDVGQGMALDNLDLQRQMLKSSMDIGALAFPSSGSAGGAGNDALPPSPSRNAGAVVAPPVTSQTARAPASAPRGQYAGADAPGSIVGLISAAGTPDELAGPIIQQLSAITKTDPNAPLDPRRTQIVQQYLAKNRSGGASAPAAAPVVASDAPEPPDPTYGGLVPKGRTAQQQMDLLSRAALTAPAAQAKVYQERIKAIQDAVQPTTEQKNARASNMSLRDYQDRGDDNTAKRDVLTKALIPELKESRDKASAAVTEIQSIHTAREQLDLPGGVFSGSAADIRLKLAKVASLIGVQNSDKIANTESFGSAIGAQVLSLVKGLGAGTGISNADRDFARDMAGGNIKLDENTMRRVLDISEKAARVRIDRHNKYADRIIGSNDYLKDYRDVYNVENPEAYKLPQRAAAPQRATPAAAAQAQPRQAPDGNFYIPDPQRPGKYLRVVQ